MSEPAAPGRPNVARAYDYLLGGSIHTAVDRAAADHMVKMLPELAQSAWANRGFLQRAVTRMVEEGSVCQFLDLGAGLPTQRSTHEVLAERCPDGRVVYVDSDPFAVEKGTELLGGIPGVAMLQADLRDVDAVLSAPVTRELIDLAKPVGILLVTITQFLLDEDDPWGLVRRYLAAVPSGSYVAISAPTGDKQSDRIVDEVRSSIARSATPVVERSREEFARFFDGLQIVSPYPGAGPVIVHLGQWGAEDPEAADDDGSRWFYAAVARKP